MPPSTNIHSIMEQVNHQLISFISLVPRDLTLSKFEGDFPGGVGKSLISCNARIKFQVPQLLFLQIHNHTFFQNIRNNL